MVRGFGSGKIKTYLQRPLRAIKIYALLLFIITAFACRKDRNDDLIPNVPVNFSIQLSLPGYSNLNSPGGSVEVPGVGYKGVVVYRSIDGFVAFDMACPYDPSSSTGILHVDSSGIMMTDVNCGSRFNLTDGSIVNGPTSRPMKRYNTEWDQGGNVVHIYN